MKIFVPVYCKNDKTILVIMENSKTPYACGICSKRFHTSIYLIKHIELRHPSSAEQSSKFSKSESELPKKTSSNINQRKILQYFKFAAKTGNEIHSKSKDIDG